MKKVRLVSLHFRNFKKHKSLVITFDPKSTDIRGTNRTGKTTIADGFFFLLYGKNSENAKNFNIKTLQSNNEPIHHLEHEVVGQFEILDENDNVTAEYNLKRIYKEKWTKKKGSEEATFDTHEQFYFVNDVPVSASEYKTKVDGIISEEVSQLLTNPMYFNTKLGWKERREILTRIAGQISDDTIADKVKASEELRAILRSGKTLNEYRKELAAKRLLLKKELEQIPARIDEVDRSMQAPKDWDDLEAQKAEHLEKLSSVEGLIADAAAAHNEAYRSAAGIQNQKNAKQTELTDLTARLDREFNAEVNGLVSTLETHKGTLSVNEEKIKALERVAEELEASLPAMREKHAAKLSEWTTENARKYEPSHFFCTECGQKLPESEAQRLAAEGLEGFNRSKSEELQRIVDAGQKLKDDITHNEKMAAKRKEEAETIRQENATLSGTIATLEQQISEKSQAVRVKSKAEETLQAEIDAFVIPTVVAADTSELQEQRKKIHEAIDDLKEQLAGKALLESQQRRKEQLKAEERDLSQKIADVERIEMETDRFTRAKIDEVERRTNGLFSLVKFKMYNRLINQGEEETCECMIDGVPFSDLNNADRVNAGIDIINALSKSYGIISTIIIDNREAVVDLHPTEAQVVNLIVDEKYKELKIA